MGAGISKDSLSAALTDHVPGLAAFHCAMIGLDSAGKTTVLYRLKYNQYVNTSPTIGFNCEKVRLSGSTFTVWDVGGQDKLRPLWKSYTRCTDGIIFVVDSCKEDRMEEAKLELLRFCRGTGTLACKTPVPVLVLANKQDLPAALEVKQLEALLGLKELGPSAPWHLQPTCAITGDGLEEGMKVLHQMILRRRKTKGGLHPAAAKAAKAASSSSPARKLQRSHSHVC